MSVNAPPDWGTLASAVPLPGSRAGDSPPSRNGNDNFELGDLNFDPIAAGESSAPQLQSHQPISLPGPSGPVLGEGPPRNPAGGLTSPQPEVQGQEQSLLADLGDFDFSDPVDSAPQAIALGFGAEGDSAGAELSEQINEPSFDFAPPDDGESPLASELDFSALPALEAAPHDPMSDLPAIPGETHVEQGGMMDFSDLPAPPPEPGSDLTVEIPAPPAIPPDESLDFNFEVNPPPDSPDLHGPPSRPEPPGPLAGLAKDLPARRAAPAEPPLVPEENPPAAHLESAPEGFEPEPSIHPPQRVAPGAWSGCAKSMKAGWPR